MSHNTLQFYISNISTNSTIQIYEKDFTFPNISSEFYTSSTQTITNDGQFYWNVYNKNPQTDETSEVQFAIAYGHRTGGGATTLVNDPDNAILPTRSTYAQYRALLLDDPTQPFQFENASGVLTPTDSIYVLNIGRARYREEMDAGNWELTLGGSNGIFRFIDDSGKKFSDTFGKAGRVFKVVSGSLNLGTQNEATIVNTAAGNGLGYGLFYPDRGLLVFNAAALGSVIGNVTFSTGSGHSEVGTLTGNTNTNFLAQVFCCFVELF